MVDISQTLAAQQYAKMAKGMENVTPSPAEPQKNDGGPSFADYMKHGVEQAIEAQRSSEQISAKAVMGEANLTDVVSAITRAEVTLDTVLSVRDRMMSAYQQIMRTQI